MTLISLLLLVVYPIAVLSACSGSEIVKTKNGSVQGICDTNAQVQKFLGIPFAEPPVGELRLRQAVPLRKSFGILQADKFGASCYSRAPQGNFSEDCLTLNIWRPAGEGNFQKKFPVLVWLYGGGLTSGYTADPLFEGTSMVRISKELDKPILVVTLNYRLGPFGFLNGREMADLGLLNIGMLDQRFALRWIKENISAFGGDPDKVTLAGESAGAVSTYSHMMAYGGRNDRLFRGVILQSGGAFPLTRSDAAGFQQTFDTLVNSSCPLLAKGSAAEKLDCIRKLPVDIFRKNVGSSTGQSVDGSFSQTSIQRAILEGKYIRVPTIIGTNTDEGTTSAPTGINNTDQLSDHVAKGYFRPQLLPNSTVSGLISLYSMDPRLGCPYNTGEKQFTSGTLDKMACSIFGDIVQIAPARMIAQVLASDGVPVYKYRYNHFSSDNSDQRRGISTGTEQAYVFSNGIANHAWDQNMANLMSTAWISFVHGLNPNTGSVGGAIPKWPRYDTKASNMVLNGYGSWIEDDVDRADGINFIINKVLLDGAA